MRPISIGVACVAIAVFAILSHALDADAPPQLQAEAISSTPSGTPLAGIERRVPWTSSRITGFPDPPLPYDTERAFPALRFQQPVDITSAPGMDRLFVAEQGGKIFSFPNRSDVAAADLAIDMAKEIDGTKQLYALTFHPQFARNRYCYACLIRDSDLADGTRISRFRVTETDPPRIDPSTEHVVITFLSGGHNGCCLKFGLDGCLYISTGDGTGPNPPDVKRTGQDIGDLLSSILRIDVDHADAGRNYRIPPDNPFVNTPGARPEIWAYGLRNPWRMSFDRKSGDLWVADVGWELWEMLYRVERGGNYGWAVMEGRQATNPEWPRGPTPILPPTVDHPHSESSSITGGVTYYGSRLSELEGVYLYGDYDTGKIWGLRWEHGKVAWQRELADTTLRIVGFGEDNAGEPYLLDHIGGTVNRLIRNPEQDQSAQFPRRLSETGLFASVPQQIPAPGVIPYSINAEPWEDGALAARYVALPGESQIKTDVAPWKFPKDAVLAKTISLQPDRNSTGLHRRVETQVLHFTGIDWRAYSYRWNAEQTDAFLVNAAGEEGVIEVGDGGTPSAQAKRNWHYPSRAECLRCHNPWSGSALAFQLPQLNRDHAYAQSTASQLDTFFHIGLCDPPIPPDKRTRLSNPGDATADLNSRARAYLHANCAHCHRTNAGSSVLSQMQFDLPLEQTRMIGYRPTQGTFGIHAAQVVAPGDPFRSVLLFRMAKLGGGRMPHIGSQMVDTDALRLIRQWIEELPHDPNDHSANPAAVAALRSEEHRLLEQLKARTENPVSDVGTILDRLLSTPSGALMLLCEIGERTLSRAVVLTAVEKGTAHQEVQVRDLFERFVPEEKRVKRLGNVIRAEQILKLPGEPARGRQLFFETAGVQCKNCHRIGQTGVAFGPDLDQIGKKYGRGQLLESILEPSKFIEPQFVTYVVETMSGQVHTGLLVKKDATEVVLKNTQNMLIRVPAAEIEQVVGQAQSLMPELLLRDMTAEQVADLLAYLATLK